MFFFVAVPEPVAFYPLNARYEAAEKENRQPKGNLGKVTITNGPYNEPGGAYMFYGTDRSYIEFWNYNGPDTRFSIAMMCWVQPGGQDGPLFSYRHYDFIEWFNVVGMWIEDGQLTIANTGMSSGDQHGIFTSEVLPAGKWVHVAGSYDHNTGSSSLYINGHLRVSEYIGKGFEINTTAGKARMGAIYEERPYFKGKIAEMKVYDVALNEAQIQTSIRQGSSKTTSTFPEIVISFPLC